MKTWRILIISVGSLLLFAVLTLVGLLIWNAGVVEAPETQPSTQCTTLPEETTWVETETTVPEETTMFPEETTLPQETTLSEETTLPEETTVPETTQAVTLPPETTAPPETTLSPETAAPTESLASDSSISLNAHHAFVYDCSTGTYLYYKGNLDDPLAPASMTKLFTAYVALQYLSLDTVLTAGEEVSWIDPASSIAYIRQGHQVTVDTCVQGMIMVSGNDAAYVLAVNAGRAILGQSDGDAQVAFDAFVGEMNAQAADLGLTGSHFANPDGIDDAAHYISPRDMCAIAQLALSNQTISRYSSMLRDTVYYVSGESMTWTNTNYLLHTGNAYYCADAIGLKTGHTSGAGDCLISAFQQEDRTLIICVYGCTDSSARYTDTLKLYELFR